MRRKSRTLLAVSVAAGLMAAMSATPAAAADMPDIKILVSNCFNCHGTNGVSAGIIDGLDELSSKRMTKAMMEFKTGDKAATIMDRIARGYSDAEIMAITKYLASVNGND